MRGGPITTTTSDIDARRYRIVSVLGKGGFGKVYRAVLEGPGGFHKDVAIKLMRDEEVPELTLQRFRDEARILGLVRDRGIVNVDPPTRLAGRWAVVMEFVDGASLQRLMGLGPIPACAAADLVQEIARVLDKVYRSAGPNGEPLCILHRDIKPANIQVTPDGEVKVLDFGIAKADFTAREAHTTAYVGGTRGYIAPERLEGVDTPAGDVFSLGVTTHLIVSGERPTRRQMMGLDDPDTMQVDHATRAMIALAARMRSADPNERPSARQVEEACAQIRRKYDGESLRSWAERTVPRAIALKFSDEMVGSVLSETLASSVPSEERLRSGHELVEYHTEEPRPRRRRRPLAIAAMFAFGFGAAGVAVVGAVLVAALVFFTATRWLDEPLAVTPPLVMAQRPVTKPAPAPVPAALEEATLEDAPPEGSPEASGEAVAPEVAPTPGDPPVEVAEPVPAPAVKPTGKPPRPVPARVEPTPPPAEGDGAPEGVQQAVTFSSVPLGADVYVDGKMIGQTPLMGHVLSGGPHIIKMISRDETLQRTIEVGRRAPTRYVWKGGDAWEQHY